MGNIIEHKCPNCGGTLKFDASTQKVKCKYCDAEFDVEALLAADEQLDEIKSNIDLGAHETISEKDGQSFVIYRCDSCGSEIICDENTTSTVCPYCDQAVILAGRLSGELKPDYVIPFQKDKRTARDDFDKFLKKKWFVPSVFRREKHVEEVKPVYVPFWLYDADVFADIKFHGVITRRWSDSNYEYTERNHYTLIREGNIAFDHIPVNASTKAPDNLMESIEPFNFGKTDEFKTGYLTGFLAEKYDVSKEECHERAKQRIKNSTIQMFRNTTRRFNEVTVTSSFIDLSNEKAKYALYPVWFLNIYWNGKRYQYAMNGESGKFAGVLPVSYWKVLLFSLIIGILSGGFGYLIGYLIQVSTKLDPSSNVGLIGMAIAFVIGWVIAFVVPIVKYKKVRKDNYAAAYVRKDSFQLTKNVDLFLYRTVSKVKISRPENNNH